MPYLDHVNALLHQAVATCKAAIQVSKLPEPLVKKENMPPGKSLDHQWRFVKTTKTPGRKRNGNILRYSYYIIHRNRNSKIRYLILIKACWLWGESKNNSQAYKWSKWSTYRHVVYGAVYTYKLWHTCPLPSKFIIGEQQPRNNRWYRDVTSHSDITITARYTVYVNKYVFMILTQIAKTIHPVLTIKLLQVHTCIYITMYFMISKLLISKCTSVQLYRS